MSGPTKGPWGLSNPPYDSVPWLHVYGPQDSDGVARHIMHADRSFDEKLANAHLIAAAPDLLEMCIWAEAAIAPFSKEPQERSGIVRLRAAIAKATSLRPVGDT